MLVLETEGGRSEFLVGSFERQDRRNAVRRIHVDGQGRACRRALTTRDGLLLPPGATSETHENEDGDTVAQADLTRVDADGAILRRLPSTAGRPQRPEGPVRPQTVLDHVVSRVHRLEPQRLAPDLADALAAGAVHRVEWRPRPSATNRPAFLLANDHGHFLLLCEPHGAEFVARDQTTTPEDDCDYDDANANADANADADAERDAHAAPVRCSALSTTASGEGPAFGEALP